LLVAVLACGPARDVPTFEFVAMDDDINLIFNPHLGPPSVERLQWMFTDATTMRRYIPLGWLSFSVVYAWSGLSPVGYHFANVGLHAVNSALVFAVLLALLRRYGADGERKWLPPAAGLGAAWWALHPFRAETIGWASGLMYGVAGAFALLSVLAYLRSWRVVEAPRARRVRWLVGAALLYSASLLTYPIALGLVGVFLLIDAAEFQRAARRGLTPWPPGGWRRVLLEKLLVAVPCLSVFAVTVRAGRAASAFWPPPPPWSEFGFWMRVQQAVEAWFYYVWKPWWPTGLTPVPAWLIELDERGARTLLAAVLVLGVTALLGWRRRGRDGLWLLWLAHLAVLVPMLGLNDRPYHPADRYHYLAAIVVAAAVAFAVVRASGGWRWAAMGVGVVVVLILGFRQRAQLGYWASTDTLLRRVIDVAGHEGVRQAYYRRWIFFHFARGANARGELLATEAGLDAKRIAAEATVDGVPLAAARHAQIALEMARGNRVREAQEHFGAALHLAPDWREPAYNWAMLLARQGDAAQAWHRYRRAVEGAPKREISAAARQRLVAQIAEGFFATNHPAAACRILEQVIRELDATAENDSAAASGLRAQLERYRAAK